jgi:hypothetical protein
MTHTLGRAAITRKAVLSAGLLVALGVSTGLLVGLTIVHLLGFLGLHVDTGIATLLHRAFLGGS